MTAHPTAAIEPMIRYMSRHIQLTEHEINTLANHVVQRRYRKGQYIVQQGDVCRHESFVVRGCFRTFYVDREGQEHIVMFAIEDWWTGDLGSFITQTPADYNVECLEDAEVLQIPFETLEKLYREIPKLERLFRIITQRAFVASEKRVIRNMSLPAKERYLLFRQQYPHIEQRVPQYMIASYLGITKEFLSKLRSQLLNPE